MKYFLCCYTYCAEGAVVEEEGGAESSPGVPRALVVVANHHHVVKAPAKVWNVSTLKKNEAFLVCFSLFTKMKELTSHSPYSQS